MRLANAGTAALAGVAVVLILGLFVPVSVGLTLGALAATAVTLWADTDRYGLVGAAFLLGVGTAIATGWFPPAWARTPMVAVWLFGLLSLTIAVARFLLGFLGRRVVAQFVPEDDADGIWNALSAFGGTLVIAWSVLTAQEKAARIGGISLGGSVTMLLDTLGYEVPVYVPLVREALAVTVRGVELSVPLWVVANGIDAAMIVFVGCVIVGFHTLGTVSATWGAVKDTSGYAAGKAREAGSADPAVAGGGSTAPAPDQPHAPTPEEPRESAGEPAGRDTTGSDRDTRE